MSNESKKGEEEPRARAQPDSGPPAPGPAPDTETQTELIETVTTDESEVVEDAGAEMVQLLSRRKALRRKAVDAVERAMDAKKWSWCRATNSRVYEDDHATQLRAATLYLEYVVGKPAERALVLTNTKGEGITLDELMASPALRRALARKLETTESGGVQKGGGNT